MKSSEQFAIEWNLSKRTINDLCNKGKIPGAIKEGIWPVYHIPECDGSWRFVGIDGVNKNGVIGDGNSQFVEILPPRYAGTNKT